MHVCLFDIDGTLVSSGGAGKTAMATALRQLHGAGATTDGVPFSGRTDRAIVRELFQRHGISQAPQNFDRFLAAYLAHLPGCLASHQGRVLPGIAGLLPQLGERDDVCLGLLTGNIRAGARIKLGHFELFHYFRLGGFGDSHFERDDVAREALVELRTQLPSIELERVWVIGDTPLDVRCARAIGARAVAVATGWHAPEELAESKPDLLFNDLTDPELLLERLQ